MRSVRTSLAISHRRDLPDAPSISAASPVPARGRIGNRRIRVARSPQSRFYDDMPAADSEESRNRMLAEVRRDIPDEAQTAIPDCDRFGAMACMNRKRLGMPPRALKRCSGVNAVAGVKSG